MSRHLLEPEQLDQHLKQLNDISESPWIVENDKLYRQFQFKNFIQAMGFMTSAAIVAEKMNHHPEWSNVYKTVDVYLTTHSSGGITELDFELAENMEKLVH